MFKSLLTRSLHVAHQILSIGILALCSWSYASSVEQPPQLTLGFNAFYPSGFPTREYQFVAPAGSYSGVLISKFDWRLVRRDNGAVTRYERKTYSPAIDNIPRITASLPRNNVEYFLQARAIDSSGRAGVWGGGLVRNGMGVNSLRRTDYGFSIVWRNLDRETGSSSTYYDGRRRFLAARNVTKNTTWRTVGLLGKSWYDDAGRSGEITNPARMLASPLSLNESKPGDTIALYVYNVDRDGYVSPISNVVSFAFDGFPPSGVN